MQSTPVHIRTSHTFIIKLLSIFYAVNTKFLFSELLFDCNFEGKEAGSRGNTSRERGSEEISNVIF